MIKIPHLIASLLRGQVGRSSLASGAEHARTGRSLLLLIFGCGAFYGACMGLYGALRGTDYGAGHVLAVMLKVPALFLLTLLVTAPSMYVFASLARADLHIRQTVRLMLAGAGLTLVVLASFGPITAFFTFSTKSHPFMQLLNVAFFGIAGLIGLGFLARNLVTAAPRPEPKGKQAVAAVVRVWFVIYGVVGLQMGWLLRPFVGSPGLPAEFLRETEGNALEGVLEALRHVF